MVWNAKDISQLGYACRTLEEGVAYFAEKQGVGPFFCMDLSVGAASYIYRGEAVTPRHNRVAFGYRGCLQYELLETDNPLFAHVLDGRSVALHHVMQMSENFEADAARYLTAGAAVLGTAKMPGARIHYYDTLETLGHYTELFDYRAATETDANMFRLFRVMQAASVVWDGSDPIRAFPAE